MLRNGWVGRQVVQPRKMEEDRPEVQWSNRWWCVHELFGTPRASSRARETRGSVGCPSNHDIKLPRYLGRQQDPGRGHYLLI